MRLVLIRQACKYQVLAVSDPFGNCQVISEITGLFHEHQELWKQTSLGLYEQIPGRGPGACVTKSIHGEILEFCFGSGMPNSAFRVFWFEGGTPNEIICSNAFRKEIGESTPPEALPTAMQHREVYFSGEVHQIQEMRGVL